ncbi:MAG: hypothetical protein ACTSU7_01870 [Candidatus Heimdallarchaeaceae archaeon]
MEKKYKNISEIYTSTSLENKRCFLLAGGPSLKNFNYAVLKDEFTIGINKTFTIFSSNINYSMDLKFYNYISRPGNENGQRKVHESWLKYQGYKVFTCQRNKYNFSNDIFVVDRINERTLSFDLSKGIYAGSNSGFGALMLAVALGSKVIYLLGYDLKVNEKNTHWHQGYFNQNVAIFEKRLLKYKQLFEEFAPYLKENGIEVINLSVNSALECFPKSTLDKVLRK